MPVTPNPDYRLNKPYVCEILEIIEESSTVKTFTVKYDPIPESIEIKPGQFVMVWIMGCDEIPMSISHIGPDRHLSITVAKVGDATEKLHALQPGDKIGIRGPYGNSYELKPGIAIVIGGGIGMASVLPLIAELCVKSGEDVLEGEKPFIQEYRVIEGVKTESEVLFQNTMEKINVDESAMNFCTDDGSFGFKGFTTEKLISVLEDEFQFQHLKDQGTPITVYACGPEIMLKKVFSICEKYGIEAQISMERMMRCGFGICGLCALEPTGLLVCKDGPIFTNKTLREVSDFGKFHRDFSGKPYSI